MAIDPGSFARADDVLAELAARLLKSSNLSDLPDKAAARASLQLGSIALQSASSVAVTGGLIDGTSIGSVTAAAGRFSIVTATGDVTAQGTSYFRTNNGAKVVRLRDRVFVGGATVNDGAKPNVVPDWLTELVNWPVYNATMAVTSRFGTIGLTAGSQTADLDPVEAGTTETTIGVASFAMANNDGTFPSGFFAAYAYYGEGRVYPGTVSNAFAAELNAINMSGTPNGTPTPYRELLTGSAQALRLASGGGQGLDPDPALSAIAIVPNQSTFNAGIVFEKGALTGADGTTGFGTAIAMASGHLVSWYAAGTGNGERTFFVTSTVTDDLYKTSVQAQDGGLVFLQPTDKIGVSFATVANAVNGLRLSPSASGSSVGVQAIGDDASVSIGVHAKGPAGVLEFTSATQASALAGGGGALPSNAELFVRVRVNSTLYVLPLLKAS